MAKVVMYSTEWCPYCVRAEQLLRGRGVKQLEKIVIDQQQGARDAMMKRSGRRTVPQIFIDDRHIGGFDDLAELDRRGGLLPLLAA